jgi:N-hydroxyarylamine O-acetyltransferase
LSGLFASLLEEIGFEVTLLNARVVKSDGSYSIEFDHLALLVGCPGEPEKRWLVDVGFGGGPLEPLLLVEGAEQNQAERGFRLDRENEYLVLAEKAARQGGGPEWIKQYAFTLQPQVYASFLPGCHYHTTSPQSSFTRKRVCTLFLPDGRATLSESRLILTRSGVREERELGSEEDVRKVLREVFAIEL